MSETKTLSKQIVEFEALVQAADYENAFQRLHETLATIEGGKEGFGGIRGDVSPLSEREATRFCSAVTTMFIAQDFKLTGATFRTMCRQKRAMAQAFEVSGYRGTSHFLDLMGVPTKEGRRLSPYETIKLLSVMSINDINKELAAFLMKQNPQVGLLLVAGFLSEQLTYSANAEKTRSLIFDNAERWMGVEMPHVSMRSVGPAYMGCSYADAANKHAIKKPLNDSLRRLFQKLEIEGASLPSVRDTEKARPKVLILAELYHSRHAMHRCYGPSIRALKDKFHLVLMTMDGECDPELEGMFDELDPTKFDYGNPKNYFDRMKFHEADILYMPSVGMRLSSILASNLRIAPIQVFTPGHPATTRSDVMDYVIVMDGTLGDPSCFSETILLRESKPYFEMRSDAEQIDPIFREDVSPVRLAVPAWSRKVTPGFLAVCREIYVRSSIPVEFHFFPNGVGVLHQALKRRIESMLPATVYPRTNYNDYIENLNNCDVYLSTFPFGSTNGIVDAVRQGLPVVNMKGPEVHTMNDSDMLRHIAQPDWLNASDTEQYIKAVVRLIERPAERVAISKAILESSPDEKLLIDSEADMSDFADIFTAMYRHHETLIQGRHTWSYKELLALGND